MAIDLFTKGNFTIHGYGLMIGIGFVVAVLVGSWRCDHQLKLSGDDFSTLAILVLVFGFLGGKILFCIVEYKSFFANPLSVLGSSGFVVYGGIFTGVLTIYLFCKIKKVSFLSYLDRSFGCSESGLWPAWLFYGRLLLWQGNPFRLRRGISGEFSCSGRSTSDSYTAVFGSV